MLSSHIFSEIDNTCDRIAIIKDGRIVSEFVADDLKHASKKFYNVTFRSPVGKTISMERAKERIPSLNLIAEGDCDVFVSVEDKDLNTLIDILSDINVVSFSNRKESLEDYFMKFYKEDKDFGGALK